MIKAKNFTIEWQFQFKYDYLLHNNMYQKFSKSQLRRITTLSSKKKLDIIHQHWVLYI